MFGQAKTPPCKQSGVNLSFFSFLLEQLLKSG